MVFEQHPDPQAFGGFGDILQNPFRRYATLGALAGEGRLSTMSRMFKLNPEEVELVEKFVASLPDAEPDSLPKLEAAVTVGKTLHDGKG
jgi:hypothetical protein